MTLLAEPMAPGRLRSAGLALIAVTAIWGSTFAISKDLLTRMSVTDYLGLRFLVAALVILAVRPRLVSRLDRRAVTVGVCLGLIYAVAQLMQFVGLQHTAPTVSAFVVSLYVVFTPMISALVFGARIDAVTVVACVVAAVGVGVMSLRGWAMGPGELLTVVAAFLYAVHILAMARWSTARSALPLTFVQLLTMAGCFLVAALVDGVVLPVGRDWWTFMYLAVVAAAVALLVQTWAQAHLGASQASVLMVLEPVWAACFGFAVWRESMDLRTLGGGALVLAAMLLVVWRPGNTVVEPAPAHP